MTLLAGEIWLADIPYTDGKASKIRPVLILWLDALDAVVAVITSAAPRSTPDVALADLERRGTSSCVHSPAVAARLPGAVAAVSPARHFVTS